VFELIVSLWNLHILCNGCLPFLHDIGLGKDSESAVTDEDYRAWITGWLKCYERPGMNNLKDHNGRTIWFKVIIAYRDLLVMEGLCINKCMVCGSCRIVVSFHYYCSFVV